MIVLGGRCLLRAVHRRYRRPCDHTETWFAFSSRECRRHARADSVLRLSGGSVAFTETWWYSANCAKTGVSPGTVLGLVAPVVVQRQVLGFDSAENCGSSTGAVLGQGQY